MILNIYKPKGWTSYDVVAKVKSIIRHQKGLTKVKVGHAGTLDPLAEGVLIVLTGPDTKSQDSFMQLPKKYYAKIAFGAVTDTYDLETKLLFSEHIPTIEDIKKQLNKCIKKYIGTFEQVAPPYSAKKLNGQRLYNIMRNEPNKKIELPKKEITIYDIHIENLDLEMITGSDIALVVLTCIVDCSSGTYIRSLAYDLGKDMGFGGVLVELIRQQIGDYSIKSSLAIDDLEALEF